MDTAKNVDDFKKVIEKNKKVINHLCIHIFETDDGCEAVVARGDFKGMEAPLLESSGELSEAEAKKHLKGSNTAIWWKDNSTCVWHLGRRICG